MSVFTNPAASAPGQARAYVAAVLDLLGDRDPLAVLRETPEALGRAVASLPSAVIAQPEAPGKWSVRQVLAHLADSDLVWGYRLRMILAHDRPAITGYDQDAWAERLRYAGIQEARSLELLGVLRRSNLQLLEKASPADLQRVGIHAERGEETVAHMFRLYAGHDLLHLAQIERIRRAVQP